MLKICLETFGNLFSLESGNPVFGLRQIQLYFASDCTCVLITVVFHSTTEVPERGLHLTTSKVMVIVWRLRGNIIRTVLYIANVLPLQWAQLTKTVYTARLGLEFVFLFF